MTHHHKLRSLLESSPHLAQLWQRAGDSAAVQAILQRSLSLAPGCRVALIGGQVLVLYAANGAFAAKLRHLIPRLLVIFRQQGWEFTAIRVSVQAHAAQPYPPAPVARTIGPTALASLEQLACRLADTPLRSALHTLLKRHSRNSAEDNPPHQ
ncbi:MAG: DciA family protein [Burkholderiales bacterium]